MLDGKAKPEIFAMGVRSTYTIHIDPKTDAITTAWIGPDQGTESTDWGPAKTENATMMNGRATGAGRSARPATAGATAPRRRPPPAAAAAPFGHPNTVGGGADGATGGYFDCRGEIVNDSPYNTGLATVPKPKPVNIWYGPQGGCYGYPVNANGVSIYHRRRNNSAGAGDLPALPVDHRRQPGADRRRHLPQAGG